MLATVASPSVLLSDLLDLLQQEQIRFETLLDLLTHERRCLRALSSAELETLNRAKLHLLTEIQSLERKRMAAVASLAQEWQVPAEELTLGAISRRVGGPAGVECRRRLEHLNTTLDAIRDANAVNGTIVSRSLGFLNRTLALVRRQSEPPPVYSHSATLTSHTSDGALIERKG